MDVTCTLEGNGASSSSPLPSPRPRWHSNFPPKSWRVCCFCECMSGAHSLLVFCSGPEGALQTSLYTRARMFDHTCARVGTFVLILHLCIGCIKSSAFLLFPLILDLHVMLTRKPCLSLDLVIHRSSPRWSSPVKTGGSGGGRNLAGPAVVEPSSSSSSSAL